MSTLDGQEIAALRQRINRLEAQLDYVYKHLGITFVEDLYPTDDPNVVGMLRANNPIEAIKYYRQKTGVGLAEAKATIDEMRARLGL